MRRTNKSIIKTRSSTNKRSSISMSTNSSLPARQGVKKSIKKVKSHVELTSVDAMRKSYDHQMSQPLRKATNQIPTTTKHTKSKRVRLENHLATPVMCREQPESIHHMFSNPPSFIYIEREKVDGSVLG
jgi:hypothetical protein